MTTRISILLAVLLCLPGLCLTNLLRNPSLDADTDADGIADGWQGEVHAHEGARGGFALDPEAKRSGVACQRIDHTSNNQAWVRASQEPIAARPNTPYLLSGWVRSTGPASVILYQLRANGTYLTDYAVTSAQSVDWTRFTKRITTAEGVDRLKVSLVASGLGSAWFDDLELYEIGELPFLKVPAAPTSVAPIAIDGSLDDPVWAGAPTASGFLQLGASGESAAVQTRVRVLHSGTALYMGFTCDEPNVPGLVRQASGASPRVWADDCVEVFLDPRGDKSGYLHLGVSAGGGWAQEGSVNGRWYNDWFSWTPGRAATANWQAAATVGESAWTAEMSIDLTHMGIAPGPGAVWRVQLCRTRRAGGQEEHSTWSYVDGAKYAVPERFGRLVFSAPPGAPPRRVERQVIAAQDQPVIIPQPRQVELMTSVFRLSEATRILVSEEDQRPEADWLRHDLAGRFGLNLEIALGTQPTAQANVIDLSALPDESVPEHPEAYSLTVDADCVSLAARGPRGRLHGVGTLRQMLAEDAQGPFCRCAAIIDWPAMSWRGWHMASPAAADIDNYKRLVDVLALLKYNTIVWEVNDQLQYESHPTIARAGAPTKAQLAELVEYAKARRFEVIPQFASFSHFGFVLNKPGYEHLAESQQTTLGRRDRFNACPSNPETYRVVFDMMAELVEVFNPGYFHIGHDESSYDDIGVCDRCKGTEPHVLWAQDITRMNQWVTERGMRMIMWGDQLLEGHTGGAPLFTHKATDLVPKDILIFDWHYSPNEDHDATLGYFKSHGFEVVACPWYEPVNVYRQGEAAARKGVLGFCGSTWYGVGGAMARTPHLPAAWVIGGEQSWSPGTPTLGTTAYQPVPQFNRLLAMDGPRAGLSFRQIDLAGFFNERLVDGRRRDGWMGEGEQYDLRSLPEGDLWLGGVPFQIREGAHEGAPACVALSGAGTPQGAYPEGAFEIPIGLATPALYFMHTSSVPPDRNRQLYATTNPKVIGRYVVNYADGATVDIPLEYLANIHDWNGQRGPAQAIGVWEGRTLGGALISLGAVAWPNPRPQVTIISLDFISSLTPARPVLFAITAAE